MIILLMLPFLFGDFVQKWYIPRGMIGECGRLLINDTDRDGNYEFYIHTYGGSQKIYIYELHLPDTWEVDSFAYLYSPLIWDVGDFDVDGFYDLVMQASWGAPSVGMAIFESPNPFSYPTQEVWRDTVGFALISPICTYDVDQDSLPEIIKVVGDTTDFDVYESVGNNLYMRIFRDTIVDNWAALSTIAFGDFDLDNQNEFMFGGLDGSYSVWECTGDNSYQQILIQLLQPSNNKDCFSVPDADGDDKLEFVAKGYNPSAGIIYAFILEATGDNTYETIQSFVLPGGAYYGGYSEAGDVDGDSVPEIALEARQNVFIIKAAGNDSFYVWETLPGNNSGSSVRVYDIDGNGLSEVIISGNNQTRIYEYQVGIVETTGSVVQHHKLEISPNPFRHTTKIQYLMRNPKLTISDASGRIVKYFNLESRIQDQESSVVWNGDDDYGRDVPQGIYFIRVEYPDSAATACKKIIKMK